MLETVFQAAADEDILNLALTHPSYTKEKDQNSLENYERLEFLGDSVLKLYISKILYNSFPDATEGDLSKIRSILVSDNILAQIAFNIGLNKLIKLGPAEEKQGGRKRESNLACALEAVFGAYFLSNQSSAVENFLQKYLVPYIDDISDHFEKYNAKDCLQQYTQSVDKSLPVYMTLSTQGPAHKPIFEIAVQWQGKVIATAQGKTKKEAQQNCAYEACKKLGIIS